jgi:hypothetical protein
MLWPLPANVHSENMDRNSSILRRRVAKDRFTDWMQKLQAVFGPMQEQEDSSREDKGSSALIQADSTLKKSLIEELPSHNDWGEMEILTPPLRFPRANAVAESSCVPGFPVRFAIHNAPSCPQPTVKPSGCVAVAGI